MEGVIGSLGGFRGVRAELLVALKKGGPRTAPELGEAFGLTANALRRHLKALEDDGLVRYARHVRGVGAPAFVYTLTSAGESLFPRRYAGLLQSALTALEAARGREAVDAVLREEWEQFEQDAGPVLAHLPLGERLALVAELLTASGYMAEVSASASAAPALVLRIHNCALGELAARFPEACRAEARTLERLLGVPVQRAAHRLDGCSRCEYATRASAPVGLAGHVQESA
jgi:DeoR family suf operon transcriptional repressor